MGYIYKISNMINGKIYIGQTILLPERRWRQHELSAMNTSYYDHNVPLHFAMKKYGLENFRYEIIEECDDDLLNEREIFWIAHFDSTNPELGYNLSLGGGGAAYYKMDEILDLWQQGKSIGQIAAELEIDRGF